MKLVEKSGKILWGLFFILAAVFIVAGRFFDFPEISVFSIVLSVFFIWMFVKGIAHRNFFEILFSVAFMAIIYDEQLGITDLTPWPVLGAALLASIGLSMIFKPKKRHFSVEYNSNDGASCENCGGEEIRCENNFGSSIKYIDSDNFRTAHLENNFGSLSVYFDNAVIMNGTANVYVDNNFGEIKLFIPRTWKTINNITHTFGSVDEKGRYEGTSECSIYLQGDCNFGSVEIHYI